jgi:hypothetical protein
VKTASAGFEIRMAPAWRWLRNVLIAAAAAALLAWAGMLIEGGEAAHAVFALPLLLPIVAAASWRSEERGQLVLDGVGWCFEGAVSDPVRRPGELVVAMDLGSWMLLSLRLGDAPWSRNRRWFALSRRDMPATWQAFRRAVYSPRPPPAGPSAQAPADPPA